MKLKLIFLACIPLTLAACQSTDIQKAGDLAVSVLQQQNPSKTLSAYEWHLDTGADKHMVVRFSDQGRYSISTTCNTLGGSFSVSNNQIETSQGMSTMMACNEEAMKQEGLASQIFSDKKAPFILNTSDVNQPTLTIVASNGQRYEFKGKMTPETKYQGQGETIFLEISPETKPCTGVAQQTCLQVKEIKYDGKGLKTHVDANWSLFYDSIEGFEHTPNERQVIRVKRYTIKNPAADQSKYAYVHDMTVEREALKGSL